jgi:hypothetical protein
MLLLTVAQSWIGSRSRVRTATSSTGRAGQEERPAFEEDSRVGDG